MIELPDFVTIAEADPTFVDMGFTQRGIGSSSRIDRKGSRYRIACSCGPFEVEAGRVMVSRLIAGKQEGIRISVPLLHHQGSPGAAVVDGAVFTGKALALRNVTPGYYCKEGFWLSIEQSGQHFLHNVRTPGRADASGNLSITLNEMIRAQISDGAAVNLAKPVIEGLVDGEEWTWNLSVSRAIPIQFAIEEQK